MGYHKRKITKGEIGKVTKIREELEELEDAIEQNAKIMVMCELADLYGAIRHFVKAHTRLTMQDLEKMADLTESAFHDGERGSNSEMVRHSGGLFPGLARGPKQGPIEVQPMPPSGVEIYFSEPADKFYKAPEWDGPCSVTEDRLKCKPESDEK